MKQKRARLIYNPTSGQEIMKKNVAEVLDILEEPFFQVLRRWSQEQLSALDL